MVRVPVHYNSLVATHLWHGDACDCGEKALGQKRYFGAPIATDDEGVRVSQRQVLLIMTDSQSGHHYRNAQLTAGTSPSHQHC
jgi:hypothetical protein